MASHLRQRGSYDPLPPPGGYPLPQYVKRRFSIAPQLPDISRLSLISDFTSSLDLGIELDESEARKIRQDTPNEIFIRYSLVSLSETECFTSNAGSVRPQLPKIDTSVAKNSSTTLSQASMLKTKLSKDSLPRLSRSQESRSLRTLFNEQNIDSTSETTPGQFPSSETSTASSPFLASKISEESTPLTPEASLNEAIYDSGELPVRYMTLSVDDLKESDLICRNTVKMLAHQLPNLFTSFCIVDLCLPGDPIRVTSFDMLPEVNLEPGEALFLAQEKMSIPWKLKIIYDGNKKIHVLPFDGHLQSVSDQTTRPSHRYAGQVDLTGFIENEVDSDIDIWLEIAYEEMAKANIHRTLRRPMCHHDTPNKPEIDQALNVLRSLHRDYFVIGFAGNSSSPHYSIILVSPTLSASREIKDSHFFDFESVKDQLQGGKRFVTRVKWQIPGLRDKAYCIPMFGPELNCWLCFLVDNDLPDIWIS
ncbi:MAG: hypothetical protein Q9190_004779 [Brigantiaea leucoxantha]